VEVEDFLDQIMLRIKDWLDINSSDKVSPGESPSEVRRSVRLPPPLQGEGLQGVLQGVDEFLRHSVKTHHPHFMNPLWGGFSPAAFAGEVISALAQTSMYTYELAPLASQIESAIITRMREMVGFATGTGVLTSGGSNGNLIGVLCARQKQQPSTLNLGINGGDYAVYVSEASHYSLRMVVNVLGIGYDNLVIVGCDKAGRMRPQRLLEEIDISIREGKIPLCIIATSGTTVTGAFDSLVEISEIAHSNDIWLHVDAAWGGAALFSSRYSHLMDGVELADSICWDAHKMMGIPLVCSVFIIKNEPLLRQVCSHGKVAHYLLHPQTEALDLGNISLQCGRRNDSLKLWLAWKEKGDAGWGRMVEEYVGLADYLQSLVEDHPRLEMMSSRVWSNVCFRYSPCGLTEHSNEMYELNEMNELNIQIRDELNLGGSFMVSRSTIGESVVLRAVICNPAVSTESLEKFVAEVVSLGDEIISRREVDDY